MKTCFLTYGEARAFLRKNQIPNCGGKRHIHISRAEAKKLIDDGQAEEVGPSRIMPRKSRVWIPKNSGGSRVMQYVVKPERRVR